MANGCAIVAYQWGAIPELIDSSCGVLVTFKDINGVVDALENLLAKPSLVRQFGVEGRNKVIKGYSLEAVKPNLLSAWQQILKTERVQ